MRLELVPPDERDRDSRFWWAARGPVAMRPTADSRLSTMRRRFYEEALSAIGPNRTVKVATYVFAAPGVDIDGAHSLLERHARDRGWRTWRRFTDRSGHGALGGARPDFYRACRFAGGGFADGVLVFGEDAITSDAASYEAYLNWLHDHYAFIAFMSPHLEGSPWTRRHRRA
ncbi:hypothetical protein GTY75_08840 [Streptomyces sp. SID8381]|uniref:hypothetical protein n=1 Tax=unclassified Streptomyces TaxID=2593676 RepID=UPI0003816590|nr:MULTISPECIES: hypothetical protein [unclassified Streptomyces]MYX26775.1 hypothetical protein [Streptomyces sp. SID8381]